MRELFVKYRLVIRFILLFIGTYAIGSLSYFIYLKLSTGVLYYPDFFTNLTARQTQILIENLGYSAQVLPHPDEPSMKVIINGKFVSRVIEGCNSISVLVLFTSFIIAFADRWKSTVLYIISGCTLLYAINLVRIALLSIGFYHYPWRREFLHSVLFPLIIYGAVFVLWMAWISRFKSLRRNS